MNPNPTNSDPKYISDDKRYGGKMLSQEEAILRFDDLNNDLTWFKGLDQEKARDCYNTISRLETAIAIPCAEYVNSYENRCIRDVGMAYTTDMLTPAEAIKRIQDMEDYINTMRWGPWRPEAGDWALMDIYERQIERLKKDLKRHQSLPKELESVECEFDLVTSLTESGIQGTFVLKPKK